MPKFAALIIGIDGWEQYTKPMIDSIMLHEPDCKIVVIDNASQTPYPAWPIVHRTERLCYSKAINTAAKLVQDCDWYIVLSNDVLCTGPFAHMFEDLFDVVVGPCFRENQSWQYIEGWCVFAHSTVWRKLGGWDENFQVSSWEDVDFSVSALEAGFDVAHMPGLPFIHLDQRQRFGLVPNYWESEFHNMQYFARKHTQVAA